MVRVRDVGTGGNKGHVPPNFFITLKSAFFFLEKCPFFLGKEPFLSEKIPFNVFSNVKELILV